MAFGVYVHVPYCRSICPYCDFNVYRAKNNPPFAALFEAMHKEWARRAPRFDGPLKSIYFGGGTPSLAPPELGAKLIKRIIADQNDPTNLEITLEADPGTLTPDALRAWRDGGVNRLSIGWQSSHDRLLKILGRAHRKEAGAQAVALARSAGLSNVSVDLIFAVPTQTLAELNQDLDALVALGPAHVSLYALTYHEGTPLHRRLKRGSVQRASEALELDMMELIDERLTREGYQHYETSNYARPGMQAVHNGLYWSYTDYLGLGPGAHSFIRQGEQAALRWVNVKLPEAYMQMMKQFASLGPNTGWPLPREVDGLEALGPKEMVLEQMMAGVRLEAGIALAPLRAVLGGHPRLEQHFDAAVQKAVDAGWARLIYGTLVPTTRGRQLADSVAQLFVM